MMGAHADLVGLAGDSSVKLAGCSPLLLLLLPSASPFCAEEVIGAGGCSIWPGFFLPATCLVLPAGPSSKHQFLLSLCLSFFVSLCAKKDL